MGAMKIYLAGPLFSTAEREFNARLAQELRQRGFEVFLPQESEQASMTPRQIFQEDVRGIDWADVVVANMDGPDPDSGTCWELGYAYGKGKPQVVYRTDFRLFEGNDKINLMMTESADHVIIMPKADVAGLAGEIAKRLDEVVPGKRG